ncbi:DddA-like double-stranded DNA deaminase toxin [Streptomyces lushanensis]|uniref:DddA-like double-stranded DNA deaminase toxin n=1 Tax=Streptomyces lushanensis TaxID=1434255 RepID=UPI00147523CE
MTTGRIFDSSGNAIHGEIEAGCSSDLVEAADTYLRQHGAPINPRAARYPVSRHVESQHAVWMRQNGITDATVVMNNSEGVCGGMHGCRSAIRAILPEGSTVTV